MRSIFYTNLVFLILTFIITSSSATTYIKNDLSKTQKNDITQQDSSISGRILNPLNNAPLAGVTISIKGTNKTTSSDQNGSFHFEKINRKVTLVFSYVGYRKKELPAKRNMGTVFLQQDEHSIEEVVVSTGMFTRKASSFTGATATIHGEELRRVGSINVIESLRSLDPSFILLDNNALGSDPNQALQIQLRGQTSIPTAGNLQDQFTNDPNQPLFILDGMETTLTQIVNLDITRVASVTILKDAASTALYGSKAANGVIVIETIRPTPGAMRIAYNAIAVMETPDLTSYNMMNATELLEFQRLSGYYEDVQASNYNYLNNSNLYNSRLQEVMRGVNSYWLNTPLQSTFNVRHALNVSGGDEAFTYNIGGGYRNDEGVMIGSDNRIADGNITFSYRKGKINVTNMANINGTVSNNSPYGSFSTYVNLPPFYRKTDELGNLNTDRYLEVYEVMVDPNDNGTRTISIGNPLYNATLNSRNRNTSRYLSNNFNLLWDALPALRVNTGFQATQTTGTNELYIPSQNTVFDDINILERGSYTVRENNNTSYQGFLGLIYNKVFEGGHIVNGNLRGTIQEIKNAYLSLQMVGFPAGVEPVPNFAVNYNPNVSPSGYEQVNRNVSLVSSVNYSYKNKYNFDATFNMDGANSFGTDNLYTPFWALGASWNVENEETLQLPLWVNSLRIRGNYGLAGNQSFGQFTSTSTYVYHTDVGTFGQGLVISSLGNPNLDWQKTKQLSLGVDASLFNRRLIVTLNAYNKQTDPLIATISLPTSTGLSAYLANVGELQSQGLEYNIQGHIIRNTNTLFTLGIFGSLLKNTYSGLSGRLDEFNENNRESNSLLRYIDGSSPDDLWAVPSLGIDPTTGREVFLTATGRQTVQWNVNDEVVVGNSRPLAEGVINMNMVYKGFRLSAYIRYQLKKATFNSSVFQRVENITNLTVNQDRRALYDRWQQPGDIASFRSITNTENTQMSSRFIQEESLLSGESISAGYDFTLDKNPWLSKLKLSSLRTSLTTNQLFRLSNIQVERGTSYPFSRTATFTLNAYF